MTGKLFDMIKDFAQGILGRLRGMFNGSEGNDSGVQCGNSTLPLWENPTISRMDIRRTLYGLSGASDSGEFEP